MEKEDIKKTEEYNIWHFLCRELSKLNNIIYAYEKLVLNIELNNHRYDWFIQLVLDSFSVKMVVAIDCFFQKRADVWSLYRFNKLDVKKVEEIKKKALLFINMRNNKKAHLSKKLQHANNFDFFQKPGIDIARNVIKDLAEMLGKISNVYEFHKLYFFTWQGFDDSVDRLISDLKKV